MAVEGLSKSLCKGAGSCCAAEVWGLRWRWRGCKWLYMLRNNTVNARLQPLSQLALTAPLTQGSLCGECKPTTPQSATLTALPRHAYVCHRHYSGALTQGSLMKFS